MMDGQGKRGGNFGVKSPLPGQEHPTTDLDWLKIDTAIAEGKKESEAAERVRQRAGESARDIVAPVAEYEGEETVVLPVGHVDAPTVQIDRGEVDRMIAEAAREVDNFKDVHTLEDLEKVLVRQSKGGKISIGPMTGHSAKEVVRRVKLLVDIALEKPDLDYKSLNLLTDSPIPGSVDKRFQDACERIINNARAAHAQRGPVQKLVDGFKKLWS